MRINHNIAALNTYRQLSGANAAQGKSMEKLSSGLRINKAGDDAAGLAISEKMRGQIRGLDMAAKNSQDGVSMIQTAEGALNETHDILQRMRELATQAANDTNTDSDRGEIQKEVNQLSSEINRIGNTTEFNTKSLLKGDGKANLTASGLFSSDVSQTGNNVQHTQAEATITFAADNLKEDNKTMVFSLNGIDLTVTTDTDAALSANAVSYAGDATATSATIKVDDTGTSAANSADATAAAVQAMIDKNELLKGQYTAVSDGTSKVTIQAVSGGDYDGAKGVIDITETLTATPTLGLTGANGTTTSATAATTNLDFSATGANIDSAAKAEALVGKGFTINGQQVEFYNANDGEYTGDGIGINISDAINATSDWDDVLANTISTQLDSLDGIKAAATTATSGIIQIDTEATGADAKLEIKDGGIQEAFKAKFQVGANENQSMTIDINDMRSEALGLTGVAGQGNFTATNTVTDGTDDNTVEAALDVSTHEKAAAAITVINEAIEKVSTERSKLGAFSNRLEHTINNLGTSSENLTAAESRVRDVDYALAA
ncbi:flagellin [Bacillus sp. NTK034]|uniref:flagellin N-terminal helical domain-containing protein n=1 Tax=Bacillus sp. NTK034 TaxID=2802176 RepID=UPI001A8D4C50|nr:flagellin [Bacillus sp. NTK034]MBN8201550.1 flagellin protein [Bacillus sp. NTK034]